MRRATYLGVMLAVSALVAACPDNKKPVVDAAPPPAPPVDAAPLTLPTVEEDSGADAGDTGADVKKVGTGVVTDAAKIRACCAAIKRQALGAPELIAVAGTCDQFAAQAASGTSPELKALKGMLGGRSIPGCNF